MVLQVASPWQAQLQGSWSSSVNSKKRESNANDPSWQIKSEVDSAEKASFWDVMLDARWNLYYHARYR
jgi:hypothetical protein